MTSWAGDVRAAGLGDTRRWRRPRALVTAIAARAEATLPQIVPELADLKAVTACFSNRRISPRQILESERPATLARIAAEETILLLQDTTTLDFSRPPHTRGLGPVGAHAGEDGIELHTSMAASTSGVAAGLVALELWERELAAHG